MTEEIKFPGAFVAHLQNLLGEESDLLITSLSTPPPVSIRINTKKKFTLPEHLENIPWCNTGYYLPQRPAFTLDPALHAGAYYVQEAASMFLEQIFKKITDNGKNIKVLDLSAAPGGKSTHLLSLLSPGSLLVCNEVIRSRAEVLKENIIKWGFPNVIVTSSDPEKYSYIKDYFDVIVVDAPCSGEGMFRKDKNAIKEWSADNVKLCSFRQKRILNSVWPALKTSGYLIYSTCTFQKTENEEQLSEFINAHNAEPALPDFNYINIDKSNTQTTKGKLISYRLYPHKIKGEGFFISAIKKTGEVIKLNKIKLNKKVKEIGKADIDKFIKNSDNYILFEHNKSVFAFPKELTDALNFLSDKINIIYAGVEAGKISGKDFNPAHALALSTIISDHIPAFDLTSEDALKYLRKAEIKIETNHSGWMIVKYNNLNLGWIKKLEKRINNYYPKEYRIRI